MSSSCMHVLTIIFWCCILFSAQITEVLLYFNTLMNITSTDTLYHHTLPSINILYQHM